MSVLRRVALLALVGAALALPAQEARSIRPSGNSIRDSDDILESIYSDCLRKDSAACIKFKIFNFVDKLLGSKEQFSLSEGVTVVRTPGTEKERGAPRQLTGDESVESLLFSRVKGFLETHTFKMELKGGDVVNAVASGGRALEDAADGFLDSDLEQGEGRGKKKKAAKILGPLMAALALKAAALLPLILGAIALIAGKALLVGKLALVLSAIIGLKKLLSQQKHVTYEVVAHPHHSSSHSVGHTEYSAGASGYADAGGYGGGSGGHGSGWGRALDAHDLAYTAQKPQQ